MAQPVDERRRVYRAYRDSSEVARVLVDDDVGINPDYNNVPDVGASGLEIVFLEVHEAQRGSGVGRALAETLRWRHTGPRLVAYAKKDADGFWATLGWIRHVHADPANSDWLTLFISPAL